MTNTILTNDIIAARAIAALEQNQVMPDLVYTDYSNEYNDVTNGYKRGQTITVPVEPTLTGNVWNGSTVSAQDFDEPTVDVKLDEIIDVTLDFTSYQSTTDIDILSNRVIVPAMRAIAQKINSRCLEEYSKDIPYYYGTAGSTPDAVADYTNIGKVLDVNLCPSMDRRLVIDPSAKNKFQQIDTFFEADKVGDAGSALRSGSIGEKYGLQTFMSQAVYNHTVGTLAPASGGVILTDGAVVAGATSLTIDSATLTGTLVEGDILSIVDATTSVTTTVVVAALATASGNEIALTIAASDVAIADGSAVTIIGSNTSNLAFHKDAFAFVSRPLNAQVGAGDSGVIVNPFNSQSVRWTLDYDQNTKKSQLCFDCLVGYQTLNAKLAARLLG